jgi:hypothetical protein
MTDITKEINSMRFFPDWNRTSGNQVCGLIEMMCDINILRDNEQLECVEIGSHKGESSLIISSFPFINLLHCVDPYENDDIKERLKYSRTKIVFDFSEQYAKIIEDSSIDMVYIDANHDYDTVKRDLKTWSRKVKSGGFICGHDYNSDAWLGVVQAVDEFADSRNLLIKTYRDSSYMLRQT